MKKIANFITNHSLLIVIISLILLIPAFIGYFNTKINYDILVYLPEDLETIKGQNILTNDFGIGAFSFIIIDSNDQNKIINIEEKIRKIDNVNEVLSITDITDKSIPISMLPNEVLHKIYNDNKTVIVTTFGTSTSSEETMNAVNEIKSIMKNPSSVSGMTSMVIDTRELSNSEMLTYVVLAVVFCLIVLFISTDSYMVPIFLIGNIGLAIIYNLGSNIFLGDISYITKAITAVLQLGVTMDFSIFLYHKYEQAKEKSNNNKDAMSTAICETFKSVIGSSLTTIAGFLALCAMSLTLGKDIGIVMAKGVLCGFICVITVFPALLLVFDKVIDKTKHKVLLPKFDKVSNIIPNKKILILIVFGLLLIPILIGNSKVQVYYKLDKSLPKDLPSQIANKELAEKFNIVSPTMILVNKNTKVPDIEKMVDEISYLDGIDFVLSPSRIYSTGIPSYMIPDKMLKNFSTDKYDLIIFNSTYEVASDELNKQLETIDKIVKTYDKSAIVAGEGALTKDLVNITDHDFKMVNYISIGVIFIIMLFVLKSISLPFILVFTIEYAIFTNMSISYYVGTTLPFIASIVVGTIQLGATIDYAILMSNTYLEKRKELDKQKAIIETLKLTIPSIVTSALCFFAATLGVAVYSEIDMISSICNLLSRGAIISMITVSTLLPTLLVLLDKIIIKTTKNMKEGKNMKNNNIKKFALFIVFMFLLNPLTTFGLTKDESIYSNLNPDGTLNKSIVSNHLSFTGKKEIEDETILKNILNISGAESFEAKNKNKLVWKNLNKDITYQGETDKKLPIDTKIKYYLNNKEIKYNDLIGKSGKISIKYNFINNDTQVTKINGVSKKMYTPFVVTLGTVINCNNNKNISVTNGKVMNTGDRSYVVAIAAPGLDKNFNNNSFRDLNSITISFETTNFSLGTLYIVSTPKLLESADLKIFNNLDNATSSISLLQSNMNKLEKGANDLEKGIKKLSNGSNELVKGISTLKSGVSKLKSGAYKTDSGVDELIKEFNIAKKQLSSSDLSSSLKNLNLLKQKNTQAINSLVSKTGMSMDMISQLYIQNSLQNYTGSDEALLSIKSAYELIYLLQSNNQAIDTTISTLSGLSGKINNLVSELDKALSELKYATSSIYDGTIELENGVNKLYNGGKELNSGSKQLSSGAKTLSNGTKALNKQGINKLTSYANQIKDYSSKIKALTKLSKNYNGYASNNSTSTIFISVVK